MLDYIRYKPDGYTPDLQWPNLLSVWTHSPKGIFYSTNSREKAEKNLQFKKIMEYIDGHYQEDIRLADLAACVNMTPNYFCRYFKEITHRSPMDYLNYYRVEAACERLAYTDKTVSEIAYECGFQDASYFVKVFRHYKNLTPDSIYQFFFLKFSFPLTFLRAKATHMLYAFPEKTSRISA